MFYSLLASFGSKMVATIESINLVAYFKEIKRIALFSSLRISPCNEHGHVVIMKVTRGQHMEKLDRITINPNICLGQPTIRGMRITVTRSASSLRCWLAANPSRTCSMLIQSWKLRMCNKQSSTPPGLSRIKWY